MEQVTAYKILLYFHVILGMISFGAGILASFAVKGGLSHRRFGKLFSISLGSSALVALLLSSLKPNYFLFSIGCFTLYLIASGWVWTWKMPLPQKTKWAKAIGAAGILIAGAMLYLAIDAPGGAQILLLVFGSILLIFSMVDLSQKISGLDIYARHGGRMGGAFIASVTAFAVTNLQVYTHPYLPGVALWLLPTLIGTPLIVIGIRRFKGRAGSG